MEEEYKKKKLLFLEPVNGRSTEELAETIIRQLEKHRLKLTKKKKGFNGSNHLRKQTNGSYKETKYREN